MQKILITGSRSLDATEVAHFENYLTTMHATTPIAEVLHGGAVGTDNVAEGWCFANGVRSTTIRPKYENGNGKYAPLARNSALVSAATERDALVVGYQPHGASSGTQDTLRKARKAGLRTVVVTMPSFTQEQEVTVGVQLQLNW